MNTSPTSDIASPEQIARYKERATRSRFMHQMFLGIGGATVFGLVGVLSKSLLEAAAGFELLPILGLVGIGVLGVSCLYVGAKFLSNTIMLDNDYQAKKIGQVTRAPQMQQEVERTRPVGVPAQANAMAGLSDQPRTQNVPTTTISDVVSHEKLAAMDSPSHSVH